MLSASELKFLTSLKQKKYRQQSGFSIIEHPKVIFDSTLIPNWEKVYATGEFVKIHSEISLLKNLSVITDKEMAKISQQTTPPGILATFRLPTAPPFFANSLSTSAPVLAAKPVPPSVDLAISAPNLVLWIDGLQDPGNLGTIIRTAEWFGVKNIFLSPDCAEIANPKTVAATMGAFWRVNLYPDSDLISLIPVFRAQGYEIIATDLHGQENLSLKNNQSHVLIIGSEARGISSNLKKEADCTFKIAQFGQSESLNAAVATGIALYILKK